MEQFKEVKGFATRKNAERKMTKILDGTNIGEVVRWFILALPNGRFAPCVSITGTGIGHLAGSLAQSGICVIG